MIRKNESGLMINMAVQQMMCRGKECFRNYVNKDNFIFAFLEFVKTDFYSLFKFQQGKNFSDQLPNSDQYSLKCPATSK